MKEKKLLVVINILVGILILLMLLVVVYAYQNSAFGSEQSFDQFILSFGWWSIFVFILIQAASVVFTIIPTSIGCVAGIVLFGPWQGFLYNYIGICIGSFISFGLARHYGTALVKSVVPTKLYDKYIAKAKQANRFERFFATAIVFPMFPDDIICYIAGISPIKTSRYITIILIGKPVSLILYSIGITWLINLLFN